MVFSIGTVEDSAQNEWYKGEEEEVDAVEVGFSLNELLRCCKSEGHPGKALAGWTCGLRRAKLFPSSLEVRTTCVSAT